MTLKQIQKHGRISGRTNSLGDVYRIFTESGKSILHPEHYTNREGEDIDIDSYAVFKKCDGFYQQVSPWYMHYGWATRWLTKKVPE